MAIKQAAIKGLSWHASGKIISKIISVIRLVIIARFLSPADLGQAGFAFLILSLVEIFTETGLNQAAVQHQKDLSNKLTSIWTISALRGVFLSILLILIATPIDNYFQLGAKTLIQASALIPLIKGLSNPNILSLQRNLAFRRESTYQLLNSLFEHTIAMTLVLYLKTPIALIYASILGSIFATTNSYLFVKSYWPKFQLALVKQLFSYGKWVTAGSIASYLNDQIDDFTVAKILSAKYLGYYQTAYKISNLPTTQGAGLIYQVFFPIFSSLQTQPANLKRIFKKVILISLAISLSITTIILITAPWFTKTFLGTQWLPIIPALYLFATFGFVRSNTSVASALFDATGKPSVVFSGNIIKLSTLSLLVIPLTLKYSYLGAAASVSLAQVATIPWFIYKTQKALK